MYSASMKFFCKTIMITVVAAMLLLPQMSQAALNVLQPRGESDFVTGDNSGIRDHVEDVFGNDHVMVDVARCESGFRQFYAGGGILINVESDAVGVYQLLDSWHNNIADNMGMDIYTVEGNVDYAKVLYEADGLKPWSPSSLCWDDGTLSETNGNDKSSDSHSRMIVRSSDTRDKKSSSEENESDNYRVNREEKDSNKMNNEHDSNQVILSQKKSSSKQPVKEIISKRLIIGVHDTEVVALQRLLNRVGYRLISSGPGSPGQETNYFGSLTKKAVQEFQCDNDIVCTGAEYTTGYGMVNGETRTALNQKAAESDSTSESNRVQIRVRSSDSSQNHSSADDSRSALQQQITDLREMVADLQRQLNG
jgi:hypothetical protein